MECGGYLQTKLIGLLCLVLTASFGAATWAVLTFMGGAAAGLVWITIAGGAVSFVGFCMLFCCPYEFIKEDLKTEETNDTFISYQN